MGLSIKVDDVVNEVAPRDEAILQVGRVELDSGPCHEMNGASNAFYVGVLEPERSRRRRLAYHTMNVRRFVTFRNEDHQRIVEVGQHVHARAQPGSHHMEQGPGARAST